VLAGDEAIARQLLAGGADPGIAAQPSGHLPADAAVLAGLDDLAADLRAAGG
jgi:hypothetical protein